MLAVRGAGGDAGLVVRSSASSIGFPGRAPGVLLLHGFTGTPWELAPVAEAIRDAGFAVRVPLLPGHGTDVRDLARTRWADWRDAGEAALRELLVQHGTAIVGGTSMGGLIAIALAAKHQTKHQNRAVIGLIALAPALRLQPGTERSLRIGRWLGAALPNVFVPKPGGGTGAVDPDVRVHSPSYRYNPVRAARELIAGQLEARSVMAGVRVPALVMHGAEDTTAPVEASLELARAVASRDVTLAIVPRTGHAIARDYGRDEVARTAVQFVRRIAASRCGATSEGEISQEDGKSGRI